MTIREQIEELLKNRDKDGNFLFDTPQSVEKIKVALRASVKLVEALNKYGHSKKDPGPELAIEVLAEFSKAIEGLE